MPDKKIELSTDGLSLVQIEKALDGLSDDDRQKLAVQIHGTADSRKRLRESIQSMQESLDWLRLSVKYLVFDLEATRRESELLRTDNGNLQKENERLRQIINEHGIDGTEDAA